MRRYYTAESARGTSTSHGFANDTIVKVWENKTFAQNYLNNTKNISAKLIKRSEVTTYATNQNLSQNCTNAPIPFLGEFWAIDDADDDRSIGLIGVIFCSYSGTNYERFYK